MIEERKRASSPTARHNPKKMKIDVDSAARFKGGRPSLTISSSFSKSDGNVSSDSDSLPAMGLFNVSKSGRPVHFPYFPLSLSNGLNRDEPA